MKTSELTGAALDWAVAAVENLQFNEDRVVTVRRQEPTLPAWIERENAPGSTPHYHRFTPSTDWAQGGPIIERERIAVLCPRTGDFFDARDTKTFRLHPVYSRGATYLEAAMRCYVQSKLGDEVEIPEELR